MNVTEQVLAEQREMELRNDQQRLISMATIQAGENERRRISDMLHDSVNQLLYGVKLKLDVIKPEIKNPGSFMEINELVDQAINDVRNISFTLAPSILVEFGLPATLKELAGRLSSSKLQIKIACFQDIERPALALELNIFRIIQELVNNCIKHSGATLIDIELRLIQEITIVVEDNGKGFNNSLQTDNPSGSGLSSIKNRLTLYNGTLKIDSVIGEGTTVFITFNP
jgi:signal transduction histidine kinase